MTYLTIALFQLAIGVLGFTLLVGREQRRIAALLILSAIIWPATVIVLLFKQFPIIVKAAIGRG